MFELIIYLTVAGNTEIIHSNEYVNGQACAYNQGVWAQHYRNQPFVATSNLRFDFADVNSDGEYEFMRVRMDIAQEEEKGDVQIVCVSKNKDLRADNER